MTGWRGLGTLALFFLSPQVFAQTQEPVALEDPALRLARAAALAASLLAFLIVAYAAFARGQLNPTRKWLLLIGVVILPLFVALSGMLIMFEQSKQVAACAACHTMHPFVNDLKDPSSETLAALHYQNRWIADAQCFSCHSDYHLFGKLEAKLEGVGHLFRYYTGRYQLPIKMARPYRNSICLHCHGPAKKYQAVEAHQEIANEIRGNTTSCVECHGPVHPAPEQRAAR